MGIIKPTLSLTSNSSTSSTNPGPMSMALALSISDSLSVDLVEQRLIKTSTTLNEDVTGVNGILADGYDLMTSTTGGTAWTVGSVGSYIYMKNHSTTTAEHIMIGIVSNCDDNDGTPTGDNDPANPAASGTTALDATTNVTLRTMTLRAGEFAFFPWDYTGRISFEAATGNPLLEYWRFDKV